MGRQRKNPTSLPLRWEESHGAFYYRVPVHLRELWEGKSKYRLGATLAEAYTTWYQRVQPETIRSIGDAMDRYCAEVLPNLAPRTQVDYLKAIIRLRPVFGKMSPQGLKPRHVYAYIDQRPKIAANREKAVLSAVMSKCVRWGAVDRNLVREVARNEEIARDRYVTDAELAAFLVHCTPLLKAYVGLKRITGLRQGQLLALQRNAWDGERLTVPAAKRGKTVVYSGEGLQEAIAAVFALRRGKAIRSTFLFATRLGGPYSGDGFRSIWQRAMAKYIDKGGTRFTDHDLRAKVASDSSSLEDATARMGHQSSGITSRVYRRKPVEIGVLVPRKTEQNR